MKFKIITLGCKVNTYESEYILESLTNAGYFYNENEPDIIIINTCSVTNMADNKSLKIVRHEKRENPNALFVVCGCSVQNDPKRYQDLDIEILIGNRRKSQLVEIINEYLKKHEPYFYHTKDRELDYEKMHLTKFNTHTRAFIKIQDGCNNFCSYCIIPYTRGTIRSRDYNDILKEVNELVKSGHKEIVLTGIHTGSYNDSNHDLSDLLNDLALIDGLDNIRISSIEITELDEKFLNTLKNNSKICNHMHIPLQSGSNTVLKRMNRKYDLEYFKNKINIIRNIRKDISITTDCIVGHPYETDECFIEYLNFCKEIGFSKIHVFPYSIRTGTPSSLMPQIDTKVKKDRAKALINLSNELELQYNMSFLNQEVLVLTEEYYNLYTVGHTSNYLKVYLEGDFKLNTNYLCKITHIKEGKIIASVIGCHN